MLANADKRDLVVISQATKRLVDNSHDETYRNFRDVSSTPPKKPHVLRKPRRSKSVSDLQHASPLFPRIQISPQREVLNFLNAYGYYHWNGVNFQKKFAALTGEDILNMFTFIYGLVEPNYFGKAKGTPETIDLIVKLCKKLSTKEELLKKTHLVTPLALHSRARVFRFMAELCAHVDAKLK